jgi:hypothetical protein
MRKTGARIAVSLCLLATSILVWGQTRKAGLWELVTQTRMQYAAGSEAGGAQPASAPHTTQVCLTQEQIEKYGAIVPQIPGCQVIHVVKKPGGMNGEIVCTGRMSGKGVVESSSEDGVHAKGKIHFSGTIQAGSSTKPMEWTSETAGVFKGADCGEVKPAPLPGK